MKSIDYYKKVSISHFVVRLLVSLNFFFASLSLLAQQSQKVYIESFIHDPMDQAAKEYPKRDGSGDLRALIKVRPKSSLCLLSYTHEFMSFADSCIQSICEPSSLSSFSSIFGDFAANLFSIRDLFRIFADGRRHEILVV